MKDAKLTDAQIHKTYIGDSVYAEFDGMSIIIFTDNGIGRENEVFLEPREARKLVEYITKEHAAFDDDPQRHRDIEHEIEEKYGDNVRMRRN